MTNRVLHVNVFAAAVALAFALLMCARVAAQTRADQSAPPPATQSCPVVRVECSDMPQPRMVYRAMVTGGAPVQPLTYKWTVFGGSILSGQGTPTLAVEWEKSDSLTATVDVGGFAASCRTSASCSLFVHPPSARLLDRYGKMPTREERKRLDNLAAELRNDPTARGYLVAYGEDGARAERARSYLLKKHRFAPSRLVALWGGRRGETETELHVVPAGAQPPDGVPATAPRR